MLLDRLLANLSVDVEPFALCEVEGDCRLRLDEQDSATVHFVLQGSGRLATGGREVAFRSSDLVVVPMRRRQVVSADPGAGIAGAIAAPGGLVHHQCLGDRGRPDLVLACARLRVRIGDGSDPFRLLDRPLVLGFADSPAMLELFGEMLEESASARPGKAAMLTTLMNRCMILVFRRLTEEKSRPLPWLDALDDPRLAPAIERIVREPGAPHSVEALAAAAAMSRSAFAEAFKTRFGQSPMAFLRTVRLREAATLLESSRLGVGAVAARVGLSRSHFSTVFRSHFGVPPEQYRVRTRT